MIFVGSFVILSSVHAQGYLTETKRQLEAAAGTQGANFGTPNDPRLVVAYIIRIVLGTLGIVFVSYTVYAGFLLITSNGDEESIKKAKRIMFNGVIGTIIVLSSYGISLLVNFLFMNPESSDDALYIEYQHQIEDDMPTFNPDPLNEQMINIYSGNGM